MRGRRYSGDGGQQTPTAASTAADRPAQQSRSAIRTTTFGSEDTGFGRILVEGQGRALYLLTREPSTRSRC